MTKHPRDVNPDLVRQEVEKGRMGDRELSKKPGETQERQGPGDDPGTVWDDDQQKLVENQRKTKPRR